MACPSNPPPPAGYKLWRGGVPTPLVQWAVDLRDHINAFPYGQTWVYPGDGQTVARKDAHTWTYRGGKLVTGICIPGITLYQPAQATLVSAAVASDDVNQNPGPDVGAFGADDLPKDETNWGLVFAGATAIFTLGVGFAASIRRHRARR